MTAATISPAEPMAVIEEGMLLDYAAHGQTVKFLKAAPGCGVATGPSTGTAPFSVTVSYVVGNPGEGPLSYVFDWGDGSPQITGNGLQGDNFFLRRPHVYHLS